MTLLRLHSIFLPKILYETPVRNNNNEYYMTMSRAISQSFAYARPDHPMTSPCFVNCTWQTALCCVLRPKLFCMVHVGLCVKLSKFKVSADSRHCVDGLSGRQFLLNYFSLDEMRVWGQ